MNYYLVKLKGTQFVDVFECKENYDVGTHVVVDIQNSKELGQIKQVMHPTQTLGPILYAASDYDVTRYWDLVEEALEAKNITQKHIEKHKLPMQIISAQYNLDKSKIHIAYTSQQRVDFRALLKDLSYDLKTRIELKQLGARDYAKIVGGLGSCGIIACCINKREFDSITMQMAKNQMMPLNNDALSGVCGSLKCCLAYENDLYFECRKKFPKIKSKVMFNHKEYSVFDFNCISEEITLKNAQERITITLNEYKGNQA